MSVSLVILMTFIAGVILSATLGLDQAQHISIASRLIIFNALLAGVLYIWHQRKAQYPPQLEALPEHVRLKTLSLRLGLLALLLYSALLGQLQRDWPASVFTFEYLVLLPVLLLLAPYYVYQSEQRTPSGEDGYYRFGQFLYRQRRWRWTEQRDWLLMWAVKIIFIPLMYSWLVTAVTNLLHINWSLNPGLLVTGLFMFGLSVDLLVATGGYLFACRLLGNEVRSTDRHWLGWLSCLICYPPLVFILHTVKEQTDDMDWDNWLLPSEPLYWLWAAAISLTWLIYWISTLHFGLRFSNLSWRGLINTGPYRYSKHPAYLAKNIYWWLHTAPFIGAATQLDLLRNLLGLTFVSLVYFLRAKTEERHLMAFAEYRAYSRHISQNGLLARLRLPWHRASA
ncbi:isoprenylcysteine carboxylmethyltransferase family protein [Halopseudomonas bauzanensis]|uniref:DUF1295 domain-containing protein n=1 Tax=Halopseudomonas bauzanensis TaxID=653930 RepID=A0A4U0YS95_9GAMM|nr:isoprenylcysteine carboxylmethyltransferase family protein [Halopseudomonas bauzanensis]TKA93529.1 DUF1295 domain-containing protein [Halopseudomonas bauzanensis]